MESRVVGCEAELALMVQSPSGIWLMDGSLRAATTALQNYIPLERYPNTSDTTNYFYGNGQRIYIDCGDHIEVSTAESSDAREVAAGHLAGLLLVHKALKGAYEDGRIRNYSLSDRVVSNDESWGFHENYLISRKIAPSTGSPQLNARELRALVPFLAIRSQIGGAGSMRGDKFYLAQKASRITDEIHSDTMAAKPLINTRDEPHADKEKYARAHIPSGDPVSPHILVCNLDITSLVFRMVEQGKRPKLDYEGNDWAAIARHVAGDLTFNRAVRGMTALDVMEKYLNTLEPIVQAGVPDAEARAYQQVIDKNIVLRRVQAYAREHQGDPNISAIVGRFIIAEVAGNHQFDWAERLAMAYDANCTKIPSDRELDYDLVSRNGKLGMFWERAKTPAATSVVQRSLIAERMRNPPAGRAEDRAVFIREYGRDAAVVDWGKLVYETKLAGNVTLNLDEPAKRTPAYDDFRRRIAEAKEENRELLEIARQAQERGGSSGAAPIAL